MKESGSFWGGYPYPCSFSGAGVKQAGKKRTAAGALRRAQRLFLRKCFTERQRREW